MGLFSGGGLVEARDAFPQPPIPPNSAAGSASVRSVNLSRAESSLQKVAIYAAVNLICSVAASLPIQVWRGRGYDRQALPTPAWLADLSADGHGTEDWIWQALYSAALRGNVVGRVSGRNPMTGQPNAIVLQHPDDVSTDLAQDGTVAWRVNGKVVPADQVWHRRLYPVPGRVLGMSPVALHATTISEGLYAQNFGAQWFLDGAHPSGILTNSEAREITRPTRGQSRTASSPQCAAPVSRWYSAAGGSTSRFRSRRASRSSSRRSSTRRPSVPASSGRGCLSCSGTRRAGR
jgi:phage portal protein BeeE